MRRFYLCVMLAILLLGFLKVTASADPPPGVIIDRSPDFARVYIGSPSLAVLLDGRYVASHDFFGPGTSYDETGIFGSDDRGKTWTPLGRLKGQWWSNLFIHRGDLYILGVSERYGSVVIRRSRDGGRTWTTPDDEKTGRLTEGNGYHCAPMPVVEHAGRLWRAMEDNGAGGGWGNHFRAIMMSCPTDVDLLDRDSWTFSEPLSGREVVPRGWLEGNAVVTPDQKIVNILRIGQRGSEKAAIVRVTEDGRSSTFDPKTDIVDFPGGANKFTIRYDKVSKRYWSLVNKEANPAAYRNVLMLTSSADLQTWRVESILLRHRDSQYHGWQYPDWHFEGDDIIAVSRTAWDGAHRAHDANFMTFHRIKNFRNLTMNDSPDWIGSESDIPTPSVTSVLKLETPDLVIEGTNCRVSTIGSEKIAYGNRKYVWRELPTAYEGWRYTRTDGGVRATLKVTASRETTVRFATAKNQGGIVIPDDWAPIEGAAGQFYYTDAGKTKLYIFERELAVGQSVDIPQGNWSGGILLLPPAK